MTAINIDHNKGIISTEDDSILKLGEKGAIQLGDGTYLDELGNSTTITIKEAYRGALRYNAEKGCLQVCDGTQWKDILGKYKQSSKIIWSLIF
jgi:hypothetical protein